MKHAAQAIADSKKAAAKKITQYLEALTDGGGSQPQFSPYGGITLPTGIPLETLDPPDPNWGKFAAGVLLFAAGGITMGIGELAMGAAFAEIVEGTLLVPETFGISEVLGLIHAPAVFAVGGIIYSAGVGMVYKSTNVMWDSGVPTWIYNKLNPFE